MFDHIWENVWAFILRYIVDPFRYFGPYDLADIIILTFLLYALYRFAKARRAGRVLLGLFIVVLLSLIVSAFNLPALTFVIHLFANVFFLCIVVIFQ